MFKNFLLFFLFVVSLVFNINLKAESISNAEENIKFIAHDSHFCLINATPHSIVITHVKVQNQLDWQGKFTPNNLVHSEVSAFNAKCWQLITLKNIFSFHQFEIEIKMAAGMAAWRVRQDDANRGILKKYNFLFNQTSHYLVQKSGENYNIFIVENNHLSQKMFLANWMKHLADEVKLRDVQMLGSHDAGVSFQDGVMCTVPPVLAVTQVGSLATQLEHGMRYFDIRLMKGRDGLHYPYHQSWIFGCRSKKPFEQSLLEIIDFIKQHPTEVIFLKISHTNSSVDSLIKFLNEFTTSQEFEKYFYKSAMDSQQWTNMKIYNLRGKIVLFLDCEFYRYLNPLKGYFSFSTSNEKTCNPDAEEQIVYDKYANTKNFVAMFNDQLNKLKLHTTDRAQLFLLSWTLTGGNILAYSAQPAVVLAHLSHDIFGRILPMPNIVYYDFEDPGINELMIKNYFLKASHI